MSARSSEFFLTRWSRLKRGCISPRRSTRPIEPAYHVGPPTNLPLNADHGTGRDDFSQYVRDDVSELVQKAALRNLWLTSPLFGVHDGLDVYRGDYSGTSAYEAPLFQSALTRQATEVDPEPVAERNRQPTPPTDTSAGHHSTAQLRRRDNIRLVGKPEGTDHG